jgi:hypothetical protein
LTTVVDDEDEAAAAAADADDDDDDDSDDCCGGGIIVCDSEGVVGDGASDRRDVVGAFGGDGDNPDGDLFSDSGLALVLLPSSTSSFL